LAEGGNGRKRERGDSLAARHSGARALASEPGIQQQYMQLGWIRVRAFSRVSRNDRFIEPARGGVAAQRDGLYLAWMFLLLGREAGIAAVESRR